MNKLALLLLGILTINVSLAQRVSKNNIYLSQEFNLGNFVGLNIGLNYDFNDKQTVRASYDSNYRLPDSRPQDYSQSYLKALIRGKEIPYDRMDTYQLAFGHIYNLRYDGSIRIKLSFGIGYSVITEPTDWESIEDGTRLKGNYSWENKKRNMTSLIINPKLELPLSTYYGVSISPVLQINKEIFYYGLSFGHMINIGE